MFTGLYGVPPESGVLDLTPHRRQTMHLAVPAALRGRLAALA